MPHRSRCRRAPNEPGSSTATVRESGALQHQGEQGQCLRDAGDHDQLIRVGPDAPVSGQPAGDRLPEHRRAGRVAVAEGGGREIRQHRPFRPQPGRPREGGEVGDAGREIDRRGRGPQRVESAEGGRRR